MNLNDDISVIKGIGKKTEELFHKIGIYKIDDLLQYYPRGYDLYEPATPIAELTLGSIYTVAGEIVGSIQVTGGFTTQLTTLHIQDTTGKLKVIWFRMPFLNKTLKQKGMIILRGRLIQKKDTLILEHPELFYPAEKYSEKEGALQPIYPLSGKITNNMILKAMKQAFEQAELRQDFLPSEIRRTYGLAEYNYALRGIHFPLQKEDYYLTRERLVFDEFLIFLLSVQKLKEQHAFTKNHFLLQSNPLLEEVIKRLPYELTNAQKKVWEQIKSDVKSEYTMSRLVQGDVGSGKTILAVLALFQCVSNGYQGALMVPTEVLAKQHYGEIEQLIQRHDLPIRLQLLTGSLTPAGKRELYTQIEAGEVDILVGTHALIQEKVVFQNLAMVITDEQHRFGVKQREALSLKGKEPHILVMSATPIPRTLAMILYGDLDISVIDEMPSQRISIKNCVVDTGYRKTAYTFMKDQIQAGHQCFIICPMVEASEGMDAENVIEYAQMIQDKFPDTVTIEYLHGKMKQAEKDEIMQRFTSNEIQILVSTTVIEVGINVPNATVMMIENAERFGLAQLHQIRGRVGRGDKQSYCIFMMGTKSKKSKERLQILCESNDGFFIANKDLKLRGPGDLFGIRQSGILNFRLADIFQDSKILERANEAAKKIEEENLLSEDANYTLLSQMLEKNLKVEL